MVEAEAAEKAGETTTTQATRSLVKTHFFRSVLIAAKRATQLATLNAPRNKIIFLF